ncbi:MAG: hypothetical protein AAF615_08745 [Pseudomonadota bacterium]
MTRRFLVAAFLAAFAHSAAVETSQAAQTQPEIPEFYGFTAAEVTGAPGSLVRAEAMADEMDGAAAYRFLYRTTDGSAEPTIASAVLVVPTQPAAAPLKTIVWAHDSVGIAAKCAPSIKSDALSGFKGLATAIDAGHAMVAPDYVGLGAYPTDAAPALHPYLHAPSAAAAVIDAVLAAQELGGRLGEFDDDAPTLTLSDEFAIYGHSQGAHAALSATAHLLASDTGPILKGLAISGVPNRLASLLPMQRTEDGLILTAHLLAAYQALDPKLDPAHMVTNDVAAYVEPLAALCVDEAKKLLENVEVPTDGSHIHALPREWLEALRENTPTELINPSPNTKVELTGMHIAQGGIDTLVPTFETIFGVLGPVCGFFGKTGVIIDYAPLGDHTEAQQFTQERAMAHLLSRLGEIPEMPATPLEVISQRCKDLENPPPVR